MKKICVLGLGYVGLPTAAVLASNGFSVVGVDVKPLVADTVNSGRIHIEEPGLATLVQAAYNSGNLRAQSNPEAADVFIISVPTPLRAEEQRSRGAGERKDTDEHFAAPLHPSAHSPSHKWADLRAVESATKSIVSHLAKGSLVILESTVPPKTTEELVAPILEQSGLKAGRDFYLAHCPERVLPGNILKELVENDRVIGGITRESAEKAREIYGAFVSGNIYLTDATSAELVKVMENTYRDVNIALANELSRICAELGLNVWQVIELANKHPRVNLLQPGPGVGGHCLSVDPWFVVEKVPQLARIIQLSRETNDSQPQFVMETIDKLVEGITNPKVTILGVTYKANIDDTRESPAVAIIELLKKRGVALGIYDPHINDFEYALSGLEEAFLGSDCVVLVTNHDEFKRLSAKELGALMRTKQVVDTRNTLTSEEWRKAGFRVSLLGDGQ
jgi:UDP-N-acetyl-D-mannosaminuronic acid dehydrogenase